MPPRRRQVSAALTDDDLAALTDALAAGRRATVYLVEGTPSLGLPAGSSARVVSVAGRTVVVRPRGIDDELPYEADELRMAKNAPAPAPGRSRAADTAPATTPAAPRTRKPCAAAEPERASGAPAAGSSPAGEARGSAGREGAPGAAVAGATDAEVAGTEATGTEAPKSGKRTAAARTAARRGPAGTKSVTVTLHGSADNQWSVVLTRGGTKPARSRPVPPESAEAAVRELGDAAVVEAVTTVINAARDEARRRVEELSRELEAARRELAALDGVGPPAPPR